MRTEFLLSLGVALYVVVGQAASSEPSDSPPEAVEFSAEWAAIRARFPDARHYRLPEDFDAELVELGKWVRPGRWVEIFDRNCAPYRVTWREEGLRGYSRESVHIKGRIKEWSFDEIHLDDRAYTTCGNTKWFRQNKDGKWAEEGLSTGSCYDTMGYRLSRVTRDAVWYAAAIVNLGVSCAEVLEDSQLCRNGERRMCQSCASWGIDASSGETRLGFGRHVSKHQTSHAAVDCNLPCPDNEMPSALRRMDQILRFRSFVSVQDDAPLFFRTRAACHAYRRTNRDP